MSERKYTGKSLDLSWKTPPWMRDDEDSDTEESGENQSTNTTEATQQTTMTTTTTTSADDADDDSTTTETDLHSTIGNGNGETVGGTSPDDFGSISTECWPSHIDPSAVSTDLRKKIIQTAAMYRDWNQAEIARHIGCKRNTVSRTLKDHWPDHHSRQSSDGPCAQGPGSKLSPSDVDDIREQFLEGESAHSLADEYDSTHPTILKAAKGTHYYEGVGSHPTVEYDQSKGEWIIPEEEDNTEPEPEPDPTSDEDYDEDDQVTLVYGSDVYHHADASGMPHCGAWEDGEKVETTVRLDETEAQKVSDECPQCRISTRSSAELLADIRAELGHPLKDEGTPLTQEELADVLSRLREQEVSA